MDELQEKLKSILSHQKVEKNKDISPYLTLRNKVIAELYVEARTKDDLVNIMKSAHESQVPVFVIGGGSNIAVTTNNIQGVVLKNFYMKKEVIAQNSEYADVLISSGYPMSLVVSETVKEGFSGFEHHLGLPGSLGGAIYMNSKWTKPVAYVGDDLLYAELLSRDGVYRREEHEYFQFDYDYSILQETKEIVIEAVFRLKKEDPELLKKRSQEALQYRKDTQPFGVATCGCFFQNIEPDDAHGDRETSAGYYIDRAGLKNTRVGDFIVSDKHANFIINQGQGEPKDLLTLIEIIKKTVLDKFGVQLKEEVIII